MKVKILTYTLLFTCTILKSQINIPEDSKWHLVTNVSDEFNDTIIDDTKWQQNGFWFEGNGDCSTFYNTNKAYIYSDFSNDGILLNSGIVSLVARKQVPALNIEISCHLCDTCSAWPVNMYPVTYTVGKLISTNRTQFGYFEVKFRIPGPATTTNKTYRPFGANFWIYGQNYPLEDSTNSCYSEIDIFEITNGQTQMYTTNSHFNPIGDTINCGGYPSIHDDNDGHVEYDNITGNEWHTGAAFWSPNRIDYYFDGQLIKTNNNYWVGLLDPMNIILDMFNVKPKWTELG